MSFVDTLTSEQKKNAEIIVKTLNEKGITNPFAQAGILAVVSKESKFIPQSENSYAGTPASRIKQVFESGRFAGMSDAQIEALARNNEAFFEKVYGVNSGSTLGNKLPGDGYKYIGRGFNQITGRYAYEKYAKKTGLDLVNKPDLLNKPEVAASVMIEFFKSRFSDPYNKLKSYNSSGTNDFKSIEDATGAYYHANAGWGKSTSQIQADATGGRKKAMERAPDLVKFVEQFSGQFFDSKKKIMKTAMITIVLIISSYVLYKTLKSKP